MKNNGEEITKILNDFLAAVGSECKVELGPDFAYWYADSVITYSVVNCKKNSDDFLANAKRIFPTINADIFLWSFLHEVGHDFTYDDLTDEEYNISMMMKDTGDYYNAPDELAATEWAGNYMLENSAVVAALWRNLQPAIMKFYKDNGVTAE